MSFKSPSSMKSPFTKLARDYSHFKEHEEPTLTTCNMFRNYVLPSLATSVGVVLLGAFAYEGHLKENYQALEKGLSAETAK
ncbi:hypothetical protein C5167_013011 [Papaver somniferum]|uniref:Uncharacterized protein n=1 Tax=Papaver somniferum TaxID=3469 RepID=A0A4Y7J346_PAPSO|nr:hypothetical protein C5167_013011 [Papaver somniferum]